MGKPLSKPNEKLRSIDQEVSYIRSSVRSSNLKFTKETKDRLVKALVKHSNDVNELKDKVNSRHLEQVQSNISHTMEDVLSKNPQEPDLDMGAVETSSFVQLHINKRQMPNKDLPDLPIKKQKNSHIDIAKASNTTLQEIEEKMKTLKPQINVAIEQGDLTQLRIQQNTIKVLTTNLEMITVKEHTPLDDKKKKLDKNIISQYHKITKAMQEIRRNKDINYLVEQSKRVLKDLEDIQRELSDIDSVVSNLSQKGDHSTLNGLRENMLIIKQKLSSIEAADETTKQMQVQLMKKHAEILKLLEQYVKGSSQSELIKAQMNYEEIIRNIASGNSIDKDEIKVKLQSLQSFIDSIKDENENVFKGKQQLLNNVRQSFSFILDKEQKIENIDIESANKETGDGLMEVYDFYNNWKTLEKNITQKDAYNWEEADKILDEIQNSIQQIRLNKTAEHSNLPLTQKLNYSTPNLSSPKPLHSKFGSNLSVDRAQQSFIKTKAKVYNLSTPQIQNINDQQVVLRNKQFYKHSASTDDRRPFSKIEEIKTQIHYIKEKFDESSQKQHLKNKLESYIEMISDYVYHSNQRIATSAKILLQEIQEMLKNISDSPQTLNDTSQRRSSIELSFENIVGIQGSVEQLEQAVAKFDGKKGDSQYKNIVGHLSECRLYLQNMTIPVKYDMIQQQKEEILNKIEVIFNVLESKCSNNYENEEISAIKKKLEILKEKVKRFSGAYNGVLYNQIAKDLKNLLSKVTKTVPDKSIAEYITKDIEKHLKILEHRATKDQSFRRTFSDTSSRNGDKDTLIKLKNDLSDIEKAIDTTPTTAGNLFLGLKSRLDLVKLGLDQLKRTGEEEVKEKDMLYSEVETLKNMVEAKISLANEAKRRWSLEQDKEKIELEELRKIEERFETFKHEIETFTGTTSDNKFYELDENSIRLVLRMDKLQFERGSDAHNRKIDVLKQIYSYGDLLDQRAKESEDLLEVERSVNDIEKNFARNLKLDDLESLQEKLLALKTRLSNSRYNNNLLQRKQVCTETIERLIEKVATNMLDDNTKEEVTSLDTENDPYRIISSAELQFNNIKKEIDNSSRTSSVYQLNSDGLTDLFQNINDLNFPENSELHSRKVILLKDIHEYIVTLDSKTKEYEIFQELNKQLTDLNEKLDNYKGADEELKLIENELKSVQSKIKNNENMKSLYQKVYILTEKYSRFKKEKETQNNYIGSATFFQDVENNLNKNMPVQVRQVSRATSGTRLAEIENEIYLVRKKVTSFMNSDSSDEYRTIEDTLLRLKMRLTKIDTERNSQFIRKQRELEEAIEECLKILDERSLDASIIMEMEETLDKLYQKLTSMVDGDEKSAIDEELISLQVKLGKLRVNDDLTPRKNKCLQRILSYLRLLKEKNTQNQSVPTT